MDIADLATTANEGAKLKLRHPVEQSILTNEDGTPMTITLAGSDSERCRKVQRQATNRRLASSGRRGGAAKLTAEELEADGLEVLVAATMAWDITLGKTKPECLPEVVRSTYATYPWLREQVDEFIADRSNFVKGSASN